MTPSEYTRWDAKIAYPDDPDACWIWTARKTPDGYGQLKIGGRAGRPIYAHRLSYEHFIGPIPRGLTLDHLCRNPSCVNPNHLEPVTNQENVKRAHELECRNGHIRTPENTYLWRGYRFCKECRA